MTSRSPTHRSATGPLLTPAGRGVGEGARMPQSDRICLGIITAPHGVKGLVRIKSFTAAPDAIAQYTPLEDEAGRTLPIAFIGAAKGVLLARIDGVADRDAAELADGTSLGRVRAVYGFGAGDSLEIERAGAAPILVPFTRAAVPIVDLAGGRLVVIPPEGLLSDHAREDEDVHGAGP